MDIRELIDTLNNVVDKEAEVMVKVGNTFTGISHINIGSGGILVHVGTGEVTPIPEPQVGDLVQSRLGAVGDGYNQPGMHDACHKYTGLLVKNYSTGMYDNGTHIGPLSDFEKVEDN